MARGLIFGQVSSSSGGSISGTARLQGIRGCDTSTGAMVNFTVPYVEREVGGWFKTKISSPDRELVSGAFVIPFSWNADDADNYARVVGNDTLRVRVTITTDDSAVRSFEGSACMIPDGFQMLEWVKMGQSLGESTNKDMLKSLTKEMKNAVTGKEFKGVPFLMASNAAMMVFGVMPNLIF